MRSLHFAQILVYCFTICVFLQPNVGKAGEATRIVGSGDADLIMEGGWAGTGTKHIAAGRPVGDGNYHWFFDVNHSTGKDGPAGFIHGRKGGPVCCWRLGR